MNKVMDFVGSPMGKTLLILIALVVLIYLAYAYYQKKYIWAGIGKKAVIKKIAKKLYDKNFAYVQEHDANYANDPDGVKNWYYEDAIENGVEINDAWLRLELIGLGIDVEKHPKVLDITNEIGKTYAYFWK